MKGLITLLSLLLFAQVSFAGNNPYDPSELTDAALTADVTAIADELDANNHDQEIMNMAFNRARVVRKTLNTSASKVSRLNDATDSDVLALLQDVVTSLDLLAHGEKSLVKSKGHLDKILGKLIDNREAPTEIAILDFDDGASHIYNIILTNSFIFANFSVTNNGNGSATITDDVIPANYRYTGGVGYPGSLGSCGAVILAGETCTISIEFGSPTAGTFQGQYVLEYDDGLELQNLTKDLEGTAI